MPSYLFDGVWGGGERRGRAGRVPIHSSHSPAISPPSTDTKGANKAYGGGGGKTGFYIYPYIKRRRQLTTDNDAQKRRRLIPVEEKPCIRSDPSRSIFAPHRVAPSEEGHLDVLRRLNGSLGRMRLELGGFFVFFFYLERIMYAGDRFAYIIYKRLSYI